MPSLNTTVRQRAKSKIDRSMQFTTPAGLPLKDFRISHRDNIMLVGSCFAANIGNRLLDSKFNVVQNPFGVQYNPFSIATVLERVAGGESFTASSGELLCHNGKWHSMMHHSDFSRDSMEELLECINSSLANAHKVAVECNTIIVTFGTAYVYYRNSDGSIAGNCHKLPGNMFTRRLLDIDSIVERFSQVMESYIQKNPGIRFLFTVSPIRHLRDGAHDNQKSKATLLLAIDRLIQMYPQNAFYFPAYEIVLDELRDYRFFADDMVHPSATAVEYIWECFGKCYFNEETAAVNATAGEIARALAHRPFDASSAPYREFIANTLRKISTIEERMPYLDFENEKKRCNTLLER